MRRWLWIIPAAMCLTLSGCMVQDWFRARLGGVSSDQARMSRANPRNGVFSGLTTKEPPCYVEFVSESPTRPAVPRR